MTYTELQITSNLPSLRGGSHPDEYAAQAFADGHKHFAITDRNTLAGIVRAHTVAKDNDLRLIVGCRLDLQDGPSLLAYPTDRDAYARLSGLLTVGKLRAPKGECHLTRADVYDRAHGLRLIAVPPETLNDDFAASLAEYREAFGRDLMLAATHYYRGDDARRLALLDRLSKRLATKLVATNDVHYHSPERRELQDVLTCIREKCTIATAGYRLHGNAERHLKPAVEMARLFAEYPDAICRTQDIAGACTFSLDELRYEYPDEITHDGRTPQQELVHLTWIGAREKFGDAIPDKVKATIAYELDFIDQVQYAPYFLTVHDIVSFARSQKILCQGRGSAANSVVCFCLGITSVNPTEIDLLFERFISSDRKEPPDIDVDFEHERREEVMQYIYTKYGRDRAGIVATVIEYRWKGAIRDAGKAMGLSVDTTNRLASVHRYYTKEWFDDPAKLREQGLNPGDPYLKKVIALANQLKGFPRHLSQHTGGFVIARRSLSDLCPIMNAAMADRTCIEWNKDDIDALGMLKVDVLALGMLSCLRRSFDLLSRHYGKDLTLSTIPQGDSETYNMICKADTIGVFQIESRAQMSMLPRLKPREFYDLVIEVAIVRPGPIQGDMVHPYLKRRAGLEKVNYVKPELEKILKKTLGVPLFQEQAMNIAIVAAGFSPADADRLRRSMATFKSVGTIQNFEDKMVNGMVANGYPRDFAQRCYEQLKGFGSYGFPESHAASFALLVYVSSWIKCHHPDVFACALLNSQPMGFYAPAQIVRDARDHGIDVRPVDINHSGWDNTLEPDKGSRHALRLGFRQVKGLGKDEMARVVAARGEGYRDLATLRAAAGLGLGAMETLANADAFRSLGLDRRQALWQVTAMVNAPADLFQSQPQGAIIEPSVSLPRMTEGEHVVQDYLSTSLSLKKHPVEFVRPRLLQLNAVRAGELRNIAHGTPVKIAGLVLVRQQPGTSSGVLFITLEDETGSANIIVFSHVFERCRKNILSSRLLLVEGTLERQGEVIHILAQNALNLSPWLRSLSQPDPTALPLIPDENRAFPDGRNFH